MQTNGKNVKALLISVHYGVPQPTMEFLRCIARMDRLSELNILIVNNGVAACRQTELREAIAALPNTEMYDPAENLGYFGGAKAALDHFLERTGAAPDWVIVSNNDILIEDQDFFLNLFSQDPMAAGIIAPRIQVLPGRTEQNPFMKRRVGRWQRFTMRFYSFSYPLGVTWDWLSRQKKAIASRILSWAPRSNGIQARQIIYAAHGAFMIFSRRFFEAGGNLDGQPFLFGEEISIAEMCRSLGLPVIYEPSLSVLHNEHQSVGHGMSRRIYGYHRAAVHHVLSKYFT
jgi:GT2 family glycosyltransferase